MSPEGKENIWFSVINIYAASKKASSLWEKAEKLLEDRGFTYHGCRTGKAGNASEITFDACMAGYRKFIAVGGDGTVHDVLNGIAGFIDWNKSLGRKAEFSDFTLSVIPSGSGNDWIKSLGIAHDVKKAVDVLVKGRTISQDVVKVSMLDSAGKELSVSYMANIGGIGIDARVCERVNAMKREGKRGRILYVTSLLHAIHNRKPSKVRVVCDGRTVFDAAFLSIAYGIGKYSGGGMRQTPEAVLDDGLLDMTVIPDIPLGRIAMEAPRLFTGTFLKVPELTSCRGKVFEVHSYDEIFSEPVEIDGEVVGRLPARLEVDDSRINVVVP